MTGMGKIEGRIERQARLRWVPLTQMRVNPLAQRDLNQARVSKLAAVFEPEKMDTPTVNHRGDWYYLIDGQHWIAALKQWRFRPATKNGKAVDARLNIEVDGVESTDHNKVPVTYWNKIMRDAHFFLDT